MDNGFRLASASVSDRGLSEKRPVNEDSFVELRELGLFAVADGVGGAQAGDVASQMAMEILNEAFANRRETADAEDVMRIAIESANQAIHQMSLEIPQLSTMATTIAAVYVNDNIATVAHVGDSRVYRILPDGSVRRETDDHSVVEEEVRAGRMTPEQALVHPSRNVISRALGAESTVDVELKTIMVEPGTMFLLCSDGITRHITDGEIEELFDHEVEPDVLVQQMREVCYSRGAEDNLTAVVVRIVGTQTGAAAGLTKSARSDVGLDEVTVPTARSPFDSLAEETSKAETQSIPAIDANKGDILPAQVRLDDESYLLSESDGSSVEEPAVPSEEPTNAPSLATADVATPPRNYVPASFGTYETEKPSGLSKVFSSLLFLILGVAVGAGGYFYWQQANPAPQVPVLNEPKSNDIPLTTYEELRRNVDADPTRYSAQYAPSPKDAIDHYFLARSLMLQDKRPEAKQQLLLARGGLSQLPPESARSLAIEIAFALSILETPAAAEHFSKEIANVGQPVVAAPFNSNANVAVPVR